MGRISELLTSLITQKQILVENLISKGVTAEQTEKFNSLVEKVSTIKKQETLSKKLYSFGLLSDIHIKDTNFGADDNNANSDYSRALTYFNERNVSFICIPGDIISNNQPADGSGNQTVAEQQFVAEIELFVELNEQYFPNKDVHFCLGNHDANPRGYYSTMGSLNLSTLVESYQDGTKTAEQVWNELTGKNINYSFEHENDVFIFHSMYAWDYVEYCRFQDMQWLRQQLENNKNKRVFLFFHLPVKNTFGEPTQSGAINPLASRMKDFYEEMLKYPNVIWFSGHTHYTLYYEGEDGFENPNTFQNDNSSVMIHCSSCAYTRIVGTPYVNVKTASEGYIVDVFADKIVIKGIDFAHENGIVYIDKANYVIGI